MIEKVFTAASRQSNNLTWEKLVEHSILIEYQLAFDVNFSNGLFGIGNLVFFSLFSVNVY